MAIQVNNTNGRVSITAADPAVVSTRDLMNTAGIATPTGNELDITNRVLTINSLDIAAGGTLIADDEEGTLLISGITIINGASGGLEGGTLDIGRLTPDFMATGVAKQTDGLAVKFGGVLTCQGIINWYAGAAWESTDAHNFNTGSTVNFFGGSWLVGDTEATGTSRFRINGGNTLNFNGNIAGTNETGIFTMRGRVRFDFQAGNVQNFANNGGFTGEYTDRAAFQAVGSASPSGTPALYEFFGIGSRGLPNSFVADAHSDAQLKIRNPGTAGARYNITHQGATESNSYSFMTQDFNPVVVDRDGNVIVDAFFYAIDNIGTAGGTDQSDRRIAGPANMTWATVTDDPVFGGSPNNRYNSQITYIGTTGNDGRIINTAENRVTGGADVTGRGHEIVTRLLIGGSSTGGVFSDTNAVQGGVATNYRWTTDNNDTASTIFTGFGRLRSFLDFNLIGHGGPITDNVVLTNDPVVDAVNRNANQGRLLSTGGGISSTNDIIAVIEDFQTPETTAEVDELFIFSDTADKAWTGITGSTVNFPNRNITLSHASNGVSYNPIFTLLEVRGVNTTFTEAAVGFNIGTGTFSINGPVSDYAGMDVVAGNIAITDDGAAVDISNITLNANANLRLEGWSGDFVSGVTLAGFITGLSTSPTVTINGIASGVEYPDGSLVDWSNVTLPPAPATITIRGNNLNIAGIPNADQSRVLINQLGDTGSSFVEVPVTTTVRTPREVGTFGVVEITGTRTTDFTVVQSAMRTSNLARGEYIIPNGNTNTHRFYWKRDNNANTGYATTIIERSNSSISSSVEVDMEATPYIATLYSGDTRLGEPNTNSNPVSASRAGRNNGMQIEVNNTTLTNGAESQYHILTGMDNVDYMGVLLNNNRDTDVIAPDSISSTVCNAQFIQLTSHDGMTQQQLVGTQFNNLEQNVPETLSRSILSFVTRLDQQTSADRFYLTADGTTLLQPTDRFPGSGIGADPITGYRIVVIDANNSSPFSQDVRTIADRFTSAELRNQFGQINLINSAGEIQVTYTYTGITVDTEAGQIEFTLTSYNSGNIGTLMDLGFSSGILPHLLVVPLEQELRQIR